MKKMTVVVVIAVIGLLAGTYFLYREVKRAPLRPPDDNHRPQPMNAWQAGVKPDARTDYTTDAATPRQLMEKLRAEEIRQRPQEGRN